MTNEEQIKLSFSKAKQDIENLQSDIQSIKLELQEIKETLQNFSIYQSSIHDTHQNSNYYLENNRKTTADINISSKNLVNSTHPQENPTIQHIIPTNSSTPEYNPTDNLPLYSLKSHYKDISTGSEGVPTDRQTDRQTNQQTHLNEQKHQKTEQLTHLEKVSEILDSLDDIKKDLRSKFKKLTTQEILVFSTIYQFQEQDFIVDYPILASKLSLSESSIRDYIKKIINKGVPLNKTKENNKKITLSIPEELKKIASLQTILALREL